MARIPERPKAPRLSPPDLPAVLEDATGARHGDHLGARIALGDDLAHAQLEQCVLHGAADERADLTGATLLDVAIEEPRTPVLSLRGASVRRLRITGGRIGTLDLTEARIGELELRGVRIDYATLAAAKADDVLIAECSFRALDLPQAVLSRVRFEDSRADEVDVRGLRAVDTDLRGLDALSYLDVLSLKGTTMSAPQVAQLAPVLARSLGIDVVD